MQPLEHWTPLADQLARQLLGLSGQAIADRLMERLAYEAKTRKPVALEAMGCENHWQEIRKVAPYWGGRAPFDYEVIDRIAGDFFVEEIQRMPGHEQACLYVRFFSMERLAAEGLEKFSNAFCLEAWALHDLSFVLVDALMTFANSGYVPDEFEPNELDRLWNVNEALESQLQCFKQAYQTLAEDTATRVHARLLADVCADAKQTPAFDLVDEGCQTHWDEIRIMADQRNDHLLFETLLSTLEQSAWQAIQKLPETEQYALWVDSDDGREWFEYCGGEDFPDQSYIVKSGLRDVAETIARAVLDEARA